MQFANSTEQIVNGFRQGIFPNSHEFTDQQIKAISEIPGTDRSGMFADEPMEQALIRRYGLGSGENTWPMFAEVLGEEKSTHCARFSAQSRRKSLDWLREAIQECLFMGIARERIQEEVELI